MEIRGDGPTVYVFEDPDLGELMRRSDRALHKLRGRIVTLFQAGRVRYLPGRWLPNKGDPQAGAVIAAFDKLATAVAAVVDAEIEETEVQG